MNVIALIDRVAKFEKLARTKSQNKHPKKMPRPGLATELRLTQTELVEAFGAKEPASLSRNLRSAIVVVARVHKGKDAWSTIADKANVIFTRLSTKHGVQPTSTASNAVIVDTSGPDRESDAVRFTRLANEAETLELRRECADLQPVCWGLAITLSRREECVMLPRGFGQLDLESLRTLKTKLAKQIQSWTNEIEDRKRIAEAARKAEEARQATLVPLFAEAQRLRDENLKLASEKRVRIEQIVLPRLADLDEPKLQEIIKRLKSFRMKIETRARELDPRRTGHRVVNPSPLRSPLAA